MMIIFAKNKNFVFVLMSIFYFYFSAKDRTTITPEQIPKVAMSTFHAGVNKFPEG